MRTSTPTDQTAFDQPSTIDHQRTYVADADLHDRLLASVGETITPPGGHPYSVRRRIGLLGLDRTFVTWYFDTEELDLHRGGAMLRCRGRQRPGGELPATGLIEARIPERLGMQRIVGSQQPFQHFVHDSADPAVAGVSHLINDRPLRAVASQIKDRRLLFAASGALAWSRPEIVISVDDVQTKGLLDAKQRSNRREAELQIFTKLPWTRRVDDARVDRFKAFADEAESKFGLARADAASYQAVPTDWLS